MNASIRVRTPPEHTKFQAIQGYSRLHVHTIPGHFRGIGRSSKVCVCVCGGGGSYGPKVCVCGGGGGGVGPVRQPVARIFFGGGGVRILEKKGYFCHRFSIAVNSKYT